MRIIITAGPTHENIDPVRYITNHSTGKMGYALAEAAQHMGANVTLISGPSALIPPSNITFYGVTSAQDMLNTVMENIQNCDIFISAAAVTDFKAVNIHPQKMKKNPQREKGFSLALETNPDILLTVANLKNRPFIVGFAAETENLESNAQKKLQDKKLDMIAANWVGKVSEKNKCGFGGDHNALLVLWKGGKQEFSLRPKQELANDLLELIDQRRKS